MKEVKMKFGWWFRFVQASVVFVLVAYSALASASTESGRFLITQGGCESEVSSNHEGESDLMLWLVLSSEGEVPSLQKVRVLVSGEIEAGRLCQEFYSLYLRRQQVVMTLEDQFIRGQRHRVIRDFWIKRSLFPPVMIADFNLEEAKSQRIGFQVSKIDGGVK
ncbi:MAG: hypothetical protein H6624_00105 [Bdellovibrionaceae bacterium]|nr:hypothetical protein [Bdellovibrionales bacterium]MCB9082708.1 hypothetical protein [Pseudobdellovibrionaceae bacterium]